MALKVYRQDNADAGSEISSSSPLQLSFDGRVGGSEEFKLWIGNTDITKEYTNIKIQPIDLDTQTDPDGNYVDGSLGCLWQIAPVSIQPTLEEWDALWPDDAERAFTGVTITGADFKDFWVKITLNPNRPVANISDIVLRLTATEETI